MAQPARALTTTRDTPSLMRAAFRGYFSAKSIEYTSPGTLQGPDGAVVFRSVDMNSVTHCSATCEECHFTIVICHRLTFLSSLAAREQLLDRRGPGALDAQGHEQRVHRLVLGAALALPAPAVSWPPA